MRVCACAHMRAVAPHGLLRESAEYPVLASCNELSELQFC